MIVEDVEESICPYLALEAEIDCIDEDNNWVSKMSSPWTLNPILMDSDTYFLYYNTTRRTYFSLQVAGQFPEPTNMYLTVLKALELSATLPSTAAGT